MCDLRNGAINPALRFGIALRITAVASYLNLISQWGVDRNNLYYVYHGSVEFNIRVIS